MTWREDHDHLAKCPECFTAEHFNMPEWRCTPCPRLLYQNASHEWYQHLKDCDTCQAAISNKASLCDMGETLCDKEIDAYQTQNDAGCSALLCPGKDLVLSECPGLGVV